MSSLVISGDTSGTVSLSAPAVAGSNILTLQAATATSSVNTLGTSKDYNWNGLTTNTYLEFTNLPSWVKRLTVNMSGISTNGTSIIICQIGPVGGVETSSYLGTVTGSGGSGVGQVALSSGVSVYNSNAAANVWHGSFVFTLVNSSTNTWSFTSSTGASNSPLNGFTGGSKALAGTLSVVRLTTVLNADYFDAGTVNILYEG